MHMHFKVFGLLYNITISLKSIRPNKTEIKIIADKNCMYLHPGLPSACMKFC